MKNSVIGGGRCPLKMRWKESERCTKSIEQLCELIEWLMSGTRQVDHCVNIYDPVLAQQVIVVMFGYESETGGGPRTGISRFGLD